MLVLRLNLLYIEVTLHIIYFTSHGLPVLSSSRIVTLTLLGTSLISGSPKLISSTKNTSSVSTMLSSRIGIVNSVDNVDGVKV